MTPHLTLLQRLREWLPVLPLLALLGGAYWLNQQVQPLSLDANANKRHDPDMLVDNLSATMRNEDGTPRYLLAAEKVVHYPDDDSSTLTEPRLQALSPNQPVVRSSATSGEVTSKGDQIFLRGEVRVVRDATDTQSAMTFTTDYLHVLPNQDLMETDHAVTLVDAYNTIHAVGMKYDNKARVVNLLSQVRGQHEVAKQ